MDRTHCPEGFLREDAQKVAAIGLRIATDNLRLNWSLQAQMRYEEKKSAADKALTAWNEHIQFCPICRDARSHLEPAATKTVAHVAPALLLVDDNPALLELLVEMLQPSYRIAGTLSHGAVVTEQAAILFPDLIILDLSLGDISGFEVARRLKRAGSPAKIIFLSLHQDMDFVGAAFGLGASGYVFKSRLSTDLENAIEIVLSGGHFSSIC
jgi:CheY-like chemotaxis protein